MKPDIVISQQAEEPEEVGSLIDRIRNMESETAWSIGAMISRLKQEYKLTDEQIAARTELSRETVTQRRAVWETFGDCKLIYKLSWTHFLAAVAWDDAAECLQWADEMQASVAEMKAWRRSQHGEDLTQSEQEEEVDDRWTHPDPTEAKDDDLPTLQSMQGASKETIDKPAVEGVREIRERKEQAESTRKAPSQVSQIYDGLEHSIQMIRDYQQLLEHREKTENLLQVINEQIASVSKREA